MTSTSYRMDLVRSNSLSVNSKLYRTSACPTAISVKPMFIRCCHKVEESEKKNKPLKVVGFGSKRSAILDFCLESPLVQSSSVEFWTTYSGGSGKVQRFRQITGKPSFLIEGANEEVMDDLLVEDSMSLGSIIVLVAGTGFGSDDKAATKLLRAVKSNGGLAVSIIMKPFSFEGERRKNQVDALIIKLAQFSNLSIVVDSDALLKRETVTLTEALMMANNAVLLAIMSVSALLSDSSIKTLHVMADKSKMISTSDVLNLLQHSGKAVVGFGAGYSVKASVERATFDCPFLSGGLVQAMKDVVICIIASANIMDKKDIEAAICAFRHITKSSAKVLCSAVLESTLEPNVIVSTIIITGVESSEAASNLNFWSQLSRIPFSFAQLWGVLSSKITDSQAAVLPKETSWLKETLSTRQTTLKNDTLETQTDDLTFSTDYQDGSKGFSNFGEDENNGFKPQLPCINTKSADRMSTPNSTGVNGVANNHTVKKQINGVPHNQDVVKMDQTFNFCKSSQATHNLKGEDVPDLDSAQGTCSNYESSNTHHDRKLNANSAANNQTKQHQLSSSTTINSTSTQDCLKDSFSNGCTEGNVKGNSFSKFTQNQRDINVDESSDSQYIDKGLEHWKEDTPGKSNWELPLLDKDSTINSCDTEYLVGQAEGSVQEEQSLDKEGLVCRNEDLDLSVAEAWAHMQSDLQKKEKVDDWRLPIGVKLSERNGNHLFDKFQAARGMEIDGSQSEIAQDAGLAPWNGLAAAGLSAMMDIYHAASAMVLANDTDDYRKQGSLSDRAASMLEVERGLKRKWSPIVEMQYKEGLYKGRCQGGLPEGKGRLTYKDGSFYDGTWKHGKRCGIGVFYYSSGDVFQGYWRDDLIHGKGWFYFENGDRWFADFWKGKANGEGRYYSKDGDVFFGHFDNNWRHGKGLYIEPNGTRWYEIWEQGILVHRAPLESEG